MAVPPNATLNAAGDVVGAVERLRDKLERVTIADVEETEKKLVTLATRLRELQHALENVSRIRDQVLCAERAKADNVVASADDLLAAPPPTQLQALTNLRKLIMFPRPPKSANDTREATQQSLPKHNRSQNLPASESGADSPLERQPPASRAGSVESTALAFESRPTSSPETARTTRLDPAPTVTDRDSGRRPQGNEEAQTASPVVTVSDAQQKHDAARPLPESADESRFEFDQRLLNDLIKDYGEFIIPVSKAATEPSQPTDELPDAPGPAEPEFPLVENVAPLKPTVATPKDGDLDQRLKKLIKDYGEYDLYSDHSAKRTRAGIVAVCALLVLVIAAAYFYWRSSDDTPASSPQPVQSSLQPSSVEPATKSDHPANAEPSGFRRTANNPYATKHLKSVEKGGN